MSNLEHDTTNDTRFADFKGVVHELGRESAAGKDSLPNLAIAFARAVADGVLDPAKDAAGRDGAARVFDWYATSEGKKAVHDRTENGLKANISKLRQIQNAAGNPKYDFVDVLNRAILVRRDCKDNDLDVKPAYAAYVDVAREQLKHDDEISDDMIRDVVLKSNNTREVTLEGELKKIEKALENIVTGEKWDHIKDQSHEVMTAATLIKERRVAVEAMLKTKKALSDALEAGVITQEAYDERMALVA